MPAFMRENEEMNDEVETDAWKIRYADYFISNVVAVVVIVATAAAIAVVFRCRIDRNVEYII